MKKLVKQYIQLLNKENKNISGEEASQQYTNFLSENQFLIESFNEKIKNFEDFGTNLYFESHDSFVLNHSKKYNTVELTSLFYKKNNENLMEEYGTANILLTLSKYSSGFDKLKNKKLSIYKLFITDNKIGCIFFDKNKLDYFIEDNIVDLAVIRTINLGYEEFKNILNKNWLFILFLL